MGQEEANLQQSLNPIRRLGTESIIDDRGNLVSTLLDYWQWAYSDLLGNVERGNFAEYLVAVALGVANGVRKGWDPYDLKAKNGVTVEVKASGYLQTWQQNKLTKPTFGISQTKAWDAASNQYEGESKRQADVYVFCLHSYKRKDVGINPFDLSQWEFYVLPTRVLNENVPTQKSIGLDRLKALGAIPASFHELRDVIENSSGSV